MIMTTQRSQQHTILYQCNERSNTRWVSGDKMREIVMRTTSTSKHFSVRTEFDTVHRTVMALQDLSLFARYIVNAHPFITHATSHKSVLEDGVD